MLYIVSAIVFVLLFPISVSVYVYFDSETKKITFAVMPYNAFVIFGGYALIKGGNVFLHYGKKKAKLFRITDARSLGFKPKYLKGVKILTINNLLSVKFEPESVFCVGAYLALSNVISPVIETLTGARSVFIAEVGYKESTSNYFSLSFAFDVLLVIIAIFRTLVGGICKKIKKN